MKCSRMTKLRSNEVMLNCGYIHLRLKRSKTSVDLPCIIIMINKTKSK